VIPVIITFATRNFSPDGYANISKASPPLSASICAIWSRRCVLVLAMFVDN